MEKIAVSLISFCVKLILDSPRYDNEQFLTCLFSRFNLDNLEEILRSAETTKVMKRDWDIFLYDFKIDWLK